MLTLLEHGKFYNVVLTVNSTQAAKALSKQSRFNEGGSAQM